MARDTPRGEDSRLLRNRAAGLLLALPDPDQAPDPRLHDVHAVTLLADRDAVHALRARRIGRHPSQRIWEVAWDLLARSRWPDGPAEAEAAAQLLRRLGAHVEERPTWPRVKGRFFQLRATTLQ